MKKYTHEACEVIEKSENSNIFLPNNQWPFLINDHLTEELATVNPPLLRS
jgi:hypothetical protein